MNSSRRTQKDIAERIVWGEKIASLVLSSADIMLRGDEESISYYDSLRTRTLRENKYYFKGMRDRGEDLKRVIAKAIQEVIPTSEDGRGL